MVRTIFSHNSWKLDDGGEIVERTANYSARHQAKYNASTVKQTMWTA